MGNVFLLNIEFIFILLDYPDCVFFCFINSSNNNNNNNNNNNDNNNNDNNNNDNTTSEVLLGAIIHRPDAPISQCITECTQ